jgi:hypothetical protein
MPQLLKPGLRPKTQSVHCPNFPGHGATIKRWLRGAYAVAVAGGGSRQVADVFEVDCPSCGKYERREEC